MIDFPLQDGEAVFIKVWGFCCITTCNLKGFLFGFHVTDIHKIVQIGEVKWKKNLFHKMYKKNETVVHGYVFTPFAMKPLIKIIIIIIK